VGVSVSVCLSVCLSDIRLLGFARSRETTLVATPYTTRPSPDATQFDTIPRRAWWGPSHTPADTKARGVRR